MSEEREVDPALPDVPSDAQEPAPLAPLPVSFGFRIRRVQIAYHRHFSQHTVAGDIPVSQLGALSLIVRNPGITPKELAVLLNRDAGQVTPILKHLDAKELIERTKCASDSRSHSLRATPKGAGEYRRLQAIIAKTEETFLSDVLEPGEREKLLEMLDRLEAASRRHRCATKAKAG